MIIAISLYVALLVFIIVLHQARVITVFADYTDVAFSLGAFVALVGACIVFLNTTLLIPRAVVGCVALLAAYFTANATRQANSGIIGTLVALCAKVILSTFGFGLCFIAFNSSGAPSKRSDESDAEYAVRAETRQRAGMVLGIIALLLTVGVLRLCTRRREFSSLASYLGFECAGEEGVAEAHDDTEEVNYENYADNCKASDDKPQDCYAVLGCSPEDSPETIKRQFRQLAKQYHPDVISGQGLPKDFAEFASSKFRAIREAYEAIQLHRTWR